MRKPTHETVREMRMLLNRLEADWNRVNRPQVSKELRDSLHTRIVEVRAAIANLEQRMRRSSRAVAAVAG